MDEINEVLDQVYFHNTVRDYLIALGLILLGFVLIKSLKYLVLGRIRRLAESTETSVDDFAVRSIERYGIPALYILVFFVGLNTLVLPDRVFKVIDFATTVAITILAVRFISSTILALLHSYVKKQENGEEKVKQLGGIMLIINIIVWLMGLVFLLDNMGKDVTTVIAGLGIGGIAVALAAQNILGDLFNYFVIFLDRPFEIGDFIIIDDKLGTVEYIGIKTTRVKSLSGEQLIFSNSDLTTSRIHNYKRMQRRRIAFQVGVTYQTPYEKLKELPLLLKSAVLSQELVEFDRAHFKNYGEFSLNFEVVYFVLSSDFNVYMDVQQGINLKIYEEFEKIGAEFAYPTRTLYLNKAGEENLGI